jgi:dihydrofolate reductase
VSLDGVTEAPDGWHFPYFDEALDEAVSAQMAEADAMLLGRVTYQEFARFWPQQSAETPGADFMNGAPKYVVSTMLENVDDWQNSALIDGKDFVAEMQRLKSMPGKNTSVAGSVRPVQSSLRKRLLDELPLLVHPIVIGHGKRLLDGDTGHVALKLVGSQTFETGVLSRIYQPAYSQATGQYAVTCRSIPWPDELLCQQERVRKIRQFANGTSSETGFRHISAAGAPPIAAVCPNAWIAVQGPLACSASPSPCATPTARSCIRRACRRAPSWRFSDTRRSR